MLGLLTCLRVDAPARRLEIGTYVTARHRGCRAQGGLPSTQRNISDRRGRVIRASARMKGPAMLRSDPRHPMHALLPVTGIPVLAVSARSSSPELGQAPAIASPATATFHACSNQEGTLPPASQIRRGPQSSLPYQNAMPVAPLQAPLPVISSPMPIAPLRKVRLPLAARVQVVPDWLEHCDRLLEQRIGLYTLFK